MLTLKEIIQQHGGPKAPDQLTVGTRVLYVQSDTAGRVIRLGQVKSIEPGDKFKVSRVIVSDMHRFSPGYAARRRRTISRHSYLVSYFATSTLEHLEKTAAWWDFLASGLRDWAKELSS